MSIARPDQHEPGEGMDRAEGSRPDAGFTLVDLLIAMVLATLLVGSLSAALVMALRASPTTEDRIDDARSTRTLSTWLTQDTMSTPPYSPEVTLGGFDVSTVATTSNNLCGAPGANVLHLRWTETVVSTSMYVANYRFVVDGDSARLWRYVCKSVDSAPMTMIFERPITPELDPSSVPTAIIDYDSVGQVSKVSFDLVGQSGESVVMETSSRNPSEFFP